MDKTDVLIVGAGPAGLKAAQILAEKKKHVIVIEKNKTIGQKVCAGGITRNCIKNYIAPHIADRQFKQCILHSPLQKTKVHFNDIIGATVDRTKLGKWMAKIAQENGAVIIKDRTIKKIKNNSVLDNFGNEIRFKYLIGADGSNSIVRKSLGVPTERIEEAFQYITTKKFDNLEIFVNPSKFGPVYAWIFPHKAYTSIGTGGEIATKAAQTCFRGGMSDLRKVFDKWCSTMININKAKFEAATINYDYRGCIFGNKFLIGDAAGLASGATGEGIYFAILSGNDIANKILDKKYEMRNIEHILKIKSYEETILKTLEINKTLTRLEWELLIFMLNFKWFGEALIANID